MLKKLRLKWKIFIFLLGFSSVLLLTLWLFQTVFLNDMYKFVRRLEMDQAVALVGQNIDSPDLRVLLQRFDEEKSIFVMPANEFTEPKKPVSGKNNAVPETITRTENFILRDGGTVSLTFHAMITPVDATVTTLELQLSVITLLMLLLSVLLALLMSGYVSRPIAHLNESAGEGEIRNPVFGRRLSGDHRIVGHAESRGR